MIGRSGTDSNSLWMAYSAYHIHAHLVFAFRNNAKAPEGTYVIINRDLSPIGQELAITFNIEGRATLTPRSNSEAQRVCFFFSLCPVYMITLVGT